MTNCPHCGLNVIHTGMCPRIAAIEYNADGTIRRVEYVQPMDSRDDSLFGRVFGPNAFK